MDAKIFDSVVTGFYRAATGAIGWDAALDAVRVAFDCRTVSAEVYDVPRRTVRAMQYCNRELDRAAFDFLREYNVENPRFAVGLTVPPGEWAHCHEHIREEFVAENRFYQDFIIPYDMRYVSGVTMPIGGEGEITVFGLVRSHRQGPIERENFIWLQRVGEHFREARLAYERVRRMASQALVGNALVSSFPYPMWLLDSERYVFYANRAAEREQEEGKRVALRGACLALRNNKADRELAASVAQLYSAGHKGVAIIDLRSTQSDPPIWLHLQLLVPGEVLNAFGERPQILATLFDPHQVSSLDPFALAGIFRFTPAEANVAARIAEGLTPEAISQECGTSVRTIRSQLSNVLAKLGVSRQADIVRVLRQGEALWSLARRET